MNTKEIQAGVLKVKVLRYNVLVNLIFLSMKTFMLSKGYTIA